jgi:hypothetical protein
MTKQEISVADLVDIKESTMVKLKEVMDILTNLSKVYTQTDDITALEVLKREFLSNLQYMAGLYAKIKVYKGSNHTYLETAIKKFKAETIDILLTEGHRITTADKSVYVHTHYTSRMAVAEKIIAFCLTVELAYEQYNLTLNSIIQSISVASKDLTHQKSVS